MGQMMILCFVFMCGSVYAYELQTFFFLRSLKSVNVAPSFQVHALDISTNCAN